MYHTIIIVGNLGRDPELRFTSGGEPVASMSVAVSGGHGDKKSTLWFRVSAWGKQAESCGAYLHKGSKVLVEGRLIADPATGGPKTYTRQDGTTSASFEISATTVKFLSGKDEPERGSLLEEMPQDDSEVPI